MGRGRCVGLGDGFCRDKRRRMMMLHVLMLMLMLMLMMMAAWRATRDKVYKGTAPCVTQRP